MDLVDVEMEIHIYVVREGNWLIIASQSILACCKLWELGKLGAKVSVTRASAPLAAPWGR